MKYNELLIKFMWEKQKILEDNDVNLPYMDEEVAEILEGWNSRTARRIYLFIKDGIFKNNTSELGASSCPFCVLNNFNFECKKCEYGKLKGKCAGVKEKNIYEEICEALGPEKEEEIFSNVVYKDIIKRIEDEENNININN